MIGTPIEALVTLEEAKLHLRIIDMFISENSPDDDYIEGLIVTAVEWGETFQGRSWITRSIDYFADAWPPPLFQLPRPPIQEINSITYATDDGTYMLQSEMYALDPMGRLHIFQPYPTNTVQYIKISYTAGYGDEPSSVPHRCKQAVLLLVGHWYENREIISESAIHDIPYTAELLLYQERIIPV